MSPEMIAMLIFAAVTLAVLAMFSLTRDIANSDPQRVRKRLGEGFTEQHVNPVIFKNLNELTADPFGEEDQKVKLGPLRRLHLLIEQSGTHTTVAMLLAKSALLALTCSIVAGLISGSGMFSVLMGLTGALLPTALAWNRKHLRLEKLRGQLPDAFSFMARVLRAGQTSTQAIDLVSKEFDEPLAGEFAYCREQLNLGLPMETVLRDLARRTAVLEIKMFVVATVVQREAGGNLSELLDKLSHVIRERFRVRAVVSSLTAEGRLQAGILLALPLVLFCILTLIKPGYFLVLLNFPSLIIAALISELLGAVWIRKVINFDV